MLTLQFLGAEAARVFADEGGGHRWQRVPPTERRGRVHTSTVTVAVLPEPPDNELTIHPRELEWSTCRASGNGGQNVNKVESVAIVRHLPTGMVVRCQTERSQQRNKDSALKLLRARLWEAQRSRLAGERAADRRQQVGSGMRGDKRRTIRVQDGHVHDHVTGRRWQLERYLNGEW